jgi:uncharacterized membrane protein YgdD (TMEM256/DUF423 family)
VLTTIVMATSKYKKRIHTQSKEHINYLAQYAAVHAGHLLLCVAHRQGGRLEPVYMCVCMCVCVYLCEGAQVCLCVTNRPELHCV